MVKIAGSDFVEPKEPKNQANVLIIGAAGNGKSTFGLRYAPEPVAFISLDRRADYAAYEARKSGRDIAFVRIPYPSNIGKADIEASKLKGQAVLDKIFRNFDAAVEASLKGNVRTIVLDTMTEFAEITALAVRGKLGKVKGDFGQSKDVINRHHWRLFNTAREGSANFIALGREKDEWVDNEPTGRFLPRTNDVALDAVDWAGRIHANQKRSKTAKKNVEFTIEVIKAGIDISALGQRYTEEDWSDFGGPFVYTCMMNYPGTSPEDWE